MWFFKGKEHEIVYCQLAHGSPIGIIDGFTDIAELHSKISKCYNINVFDILFCTVNTHLIDMSKLLFKQPDEPIKGFIFAHRKGRVKIVEVTKTRNVLGINITMNCTGHCIILSIDPGSDLHATPQVQVGDHIEEINEINILGKQHTEVLTMLKAFQAGSTFVLKLIQPMKAAY